MPEARKNQTCFRGRDLNDIAFQRQRQKPE